MDDKPRGRDAAREVKRGKGERFILEGLFELIVPTHSARSREMDGAPKVFLHLEER
jgi:hypothetical protein